MNYSIVGFFKPCLRVRDTSETGRLNLFRDPRKPLFFRLNSLGLEPARELWPARRATSFSTRLNCQQISRTRCKFSSFKSNPFSFIEQSKNTIFEKVQMTTG